MQLQNTDVVAVSYVFSAGESHAGGKSAGTGFIITEEAEAEAGAWWASVETLS